MISRCVDQMEVELNKVIAPLLDNGSADFVELMHRMPIAMFAPMMGIPAELSDEIAHWTAVSITPDEPKLNGGIDAELASMQAHIHMLELFGEAIKLRRARRVRRFELDGEPTQLLSNRINGMNTMDIVVDLEPVAS